MSFLVFSYRQGNGGGLEDCIGLFDNLAEVPEEPDHDRQDALNVITGAAWMRRRECFDEFTLWAPFLPGEARVEFPLAMSRWFNGSGPAIVVEARTDGHTHLVKEGTAPPQPRREECACGHLRIWHRGGQGLCEMCMPPGDFSGSESDCQRFDPSHPASPPYRRD